ncbi:hypothetical protein J6590_081466 [Homalodisca vitripennis]|nr:hypothetical protein J6590_081466 [Homalodisca vitripennis]
MLFIQLGNPETWLKNDIELSHKIREQTIAGISQKMGADNRLTTRQATSVDKQKPQAGMT